MIDRFGRNITYLRVSLIDRCNLRCLYCMPKGYADYTKTDDLMSNEEIIQTVRLFARMGIRKVRLTGGEPLLRKGVPDLVREIKGIAGIEQVVMTTNAVLLHSFAAKLKSAGLDRINISLDTLDRINFRRITGMDKFTNVMEGLISALDAGLCPLKINTVLMRGYNDHEIMDLMNFAIQHKCELRFIEWMPTAATIHNEQQNRYLCSEIAQEQISKHYELTPDTSNPHSPARTFRVKGTKSKVGFISPMSNQFCAQCNRLRIKANGMLKTCLHGKEDLDLKDLIRRRVDSATIKDLIHDVVYDRPEEHFLNSNKVKHKDFAMLAVGG